MEGGLEASHFKEAASQSWGIGDLIYLVSGELTICGNSSQRLNTEIAGQATKAATGTTGEPVHFRKILPSDVYVMNVYHTTPATAVTAQTDLGKIYGIYLVATEGAVWAVDKLNTTVEDATTALAYVRVIGFPERNPATGLANTIGDIYGLVAVHFLEFTVQTDGGSLVRNLQLAW